MHSGFFTVTIIIALLYNVLFVFSQSTVVESGSSENTTIARDAPRETSTTTRYETRRTTTTRTRTYTTTTRGSSRYTIATYRSPTTSSIDRSSSNQNTTTKTIPGEYNSAPTWGAIGNNTQSEISDKKDPFEAFLDKINFKFTKPSEYSTIYSNSYLNVQWESDYISEEENRSISVYLQGLDENVNGESQGRFIRNYINLNDKGGNYQVGELNNDLSEYVLWLYTGDYGSNMFYQGPILINGNSTNHKLVIEPENDKDIESETPKGIDSRYVLLVIFALAILFFTGYFVNLYIGGRRRRREYDDYQDYKSLPQIESDINDKEPEMQKKMLKDESINNSLAEQLQKAEQVYNSKVFKNPELNNGNIAPLVDMSSLYKSTQEILNKTKGYTPVDTKNSIYDRKLKNKNQNVSKTENESFLNVNNISQLSINSSRNKANELGSPISINSNKALSQSLNYSESQKNKNDLEEADEENDAFENYYLNQQNDHFSNNKESRKHTSPLVATVTTVEEYLAAHRNSLIKNSKRGSRTSSLINISNSNSNTSSILVGNVNSHFNVVSKLDKYNETGNGKAMSNMNDSILEELNTLERKIQQQKVIYLKSLQGNHQSIDPNQLKLQKANLHQQGIDSDQLFPNYLVSHASPPVKPKAAINSPENPTSPPSANNKESKSNSLDNAKSQESEATIAQESSDNEEEIETKVATHVCKAWYSPNMSDELRMCPGDELIILEKFNDGWGLGQNTEGNVGVFPLDCVTFIDYEKPNNSFENDRNNNQSYSSQDMFFPKK